MKADCRFETSFIARVYLTTIILLYFTTPRFVQTTTADSDRAADRNRDILYQSRKK